MWVKLRPCSHGRAIVPFHRRSNVWNGQIGFSQGNGTIAYPFSFGFRRERNHSVHILSFAYSEGNAKERNYCVMFHLSYHLFSRSFSWNGTVLFEAFASERSPSAFHFSEQYGTKWNDCVPCEQGITLMGITIWTHLLILAKACKETPSVTFYKLT